MSISQESRTKPGEDGLFRAALKDAVSALERADIPYVAIGGLAALVYARPGGTKDIDLLIDESDGNKALEVLEAAGFSPKKPQDIDWLYKAHRDEVLVDLIFRVREHTMLDGAMLERARAVDVEGARLRVCAPEDFVIMQAIAHSQDTQHYWVNALETIARQDLDWDYLLRRAQAGARRILSLLFYAQSEDLIVPDDVVHGLYRLVDGS